MIVMKRKDRVIIWVTPQHLQLAKSIASIRGMTLKDYFGKKIEDDARNLPNDLLGDLYRMKKGKNGGFVDVFK